MRGAWIEMILKQLALKMIMSLPVRGAWIEIGKSHRIASKVIVAPRAGSVD